jgi:hypothetical protein
MKEKSININIHNTILKEKKRKRKRNKKSKDGKNKKKLSIGQPSQGISQPYVTSYPSFIAPQLPYNNEAMKHAEEYIAPRTNKNQLLLTNGDETETNKTKLLLTNSEPTIPSSNTSVTKKTPIKTPIKKSVIMPKSRPTQYTQEGLMKVKTLKELRELMKAALPGIDNKLLNKITNKNKLEAIKTFLSQYDKSSEPSPKPSEPTRKPPETPPRGFSSQIPTTTTSRITMTPFETPTPNFTSQTPMTIDTDDGSVFQIKTLQKLRDSKKDPIRSNLFNKTYDSLSFIRPKLLETPSTQTIKTPLNKYGEVLKIEAPSKKDLDNALLDQLTEGKDNEYKEIAKQFIKNSNVPVVAENKETQSISEKFIKNARARIAAKHMENSAPVGSQISTTRKSKGIIY